MAIRVGILTSGGDCPGLNATLRGVAKALYHRMGDKVEIVGIMNGYDGLINGNFREMSPDEFSGILTVGGTILGTKRTPFKKMRVVEEDKVDKVAAMKKNYRAAKLDCLLCLGGNGTHKTANLLSQEGLNIIGLPKTIDNDIYGTDVTFGFHTAVDIATEVIDRIHTTAGSHSRVMCIEIMGNKAGTADSGCRYADGAVSAVRKAVSFNLWRKQEYDWLRYGLYPHLRLRYDFCAADARSECLHYGAGLCQNQHENHPHRRGDKYHPRSDFYFCTRSWRKGCCNCHCNITGNFKIGRASCRERV